ncbi:extracellular calcium-sensing receptor-like [Trichomycterus rosablanca]|uniref:extracellular calcium-sensing receptor-like n=1 Tax=Trichomycterus rosablanca TaxID=2290929 RepID=UPI002F35B1F0
MESVFTLLHVVIAIINVSKANETTCSLLGEPVYPQLWKDGDIIVGAIFPFHGGWKVTDMTYTIVPPSVNCTSLDFKAFQYSQSLIFAIEEINNSSSLLPGVSLGYEIYDTCSSTALGVKAAMALINGNKKSVLDEPCTKSAKVQAIIGEEFSSISMAVAKSIGPFSMPLISHYSTCECLSDKSKYPSFLRTIPSDYHQSRALAEMVKHFNWTWVGAIRRDDDYGNNGMAAFTKVAEQLGICLEYSLPFFRTYSQEKVMRIVETIKSSTSRVIVGFLSHWDLQILIHVFAEHNITGYQWVGTEGWVSDSLLATLDQYNVLQGAIGLAIPKTTVTGLQDFILDIKPLKSVGSAIFTIFWEMLFGCTYTKQIDSKELPLCTGEEKLSEMKNSYTDMTLMPIFSNVYKGVYAIAHTLHDLLNCQQTCASKYQPDLLTFLEQLKKVRFKTKDGEEVYFDKNGDPPGKYEIINWQTSKEHQHEFVTVGLYDSSFPIHDRLTVNMASIVWAKYSNQVPTSVCSESCPPGTRKAVKKGKPICCFDCIPCAAGEISNMTVLGKTIVVLMAFRATLPGSNIMKWFGPPQQRLSVLAFTLIQVIICVLWLIISPPYPFKNLKHYKEKIILECNLGSVVGFWAVLGYIGILALLCFVLAFLARKLPDNFNEAKFITFSMLIFCAVWITFIPAYVSSPGKFTVAVEIFAILASSFGLLFCIFLPKCYIIILKPEKNTKKQLMGK